MIQAAASPEWPDRRLLDLCGIALPLIQAPMAGANGSALAAAVSAAGGLGSLPCAMLGVDEVAAEVAAIRTATTQPFNLNFFCHTEPVIDAAAFKAWVAALGPYYVEHGIAPESIVPASSRKPFDAVMCELVVALRPAVVSFHFGLPDERHVAALKDAGCRIFGCATTVEEARWLALRGADAIVAQGIEAGGHRGMFLATDIATQLGTIALVPRIADAVELPVIAAGGIGDARGVAAALVLGASAVQLGTAYLRCPEATVSEVFRRWLASAETHETVVTNVISGRPARGFVTRLIAEHGPLSAAVPMFPLASAAVAGLRAAAEARGDGDFSPLWAGQAAALGAVAPAAELTQALARDAHRLLLGRI